MYNDADIEMMELQAAGNLAARATRKANHEPTPKDIRTIYSVAKYAAYYMSPVTEAVLDNCLELGIDPNHPKIQDAWFDGARKGSDPATVL
jgi:hypothetical protein